MHLVRCNLDDDDDLSKCQGPSLQGSIFYTMKYVSLWMSLFG